MPEQLITLGGRQLTLGPILGRGGEGEIFSLSDRPNEVIKIYRDRLVAASQRRKLRYMVTLASPELSRNAAWPTDLVDNGVLGVVMQRASGIELHEVYGPKSRMTLRPQADFRYLVTVAYNLCAGLERIHATGAVVGDFNQRNIMVAANAAVWYVDCDSFQIEANGETFHCAVGTPENLAPELQNADLQRVVRTKNHDHFTLAILIFQLLFMGRHPFAGVGGPDLEIAEAIRRHLFAYGRNGKAAGIRPPDQVPGLDLVTPGVGALFERAFSPSGVSGNRPSAAEWGQELNSLLGSFGSCPSFSTHLYARTRSACPWCNLYDKYGVIFFLLDGQGTFRIDAKTFEELAEQLTVAAPYTIKNLLPPPGKVTPVLPPLELIQKSSSRWYGVPALTFAMVGWYFGHPVIGLFVACWGIALLADTKNLFRRADHRRKLLAAVAAADQAVNGVLALIKASHGRYLSEFENQRARVGPLKQAYLALPIERQRLIADLDRRREQLQRAQFLDQCFIRTADIPGIGDKRKSMLRGYGIETAADISSSFRVPGFGYDLRKKLIAWRQQQEALFRFDPTRKVDPKEVQKVDAALFARRTKMEGELNAIKTAVESSTRNIRKELESAAPRIRGLVIAQAQAKADLEALENPPSEFTRLAGVGIPDGRIWMILALVAASLIPLILLRHPDNPAAAPDPPSPAALATAVPTTGRLAIMVNVPAQVIITRLDGQTGAMQLPPVAVPGTVPFEQDVAPGRYHIEARAPGWSNPKQLDITIGAGASVPASITFATSVLHFTSSPEGATVAEGGKVLGTTPFTVSNVTDESHTYTFALSGVPNEQTTITPQTPEDNVSYDWQTGSLFIDSQPQGARVTEGGKILGVTPLLLEHQVPGAHRYSLTDPGYVPREIIGKVQAWMGEKITCELLPEKVAKISVALTSGSPIVSFYNRGEGPVSISRVVAKDSQGVVIESVNEAFLLQAGQTATITLHAPVVNGVQIEIQSDPADVGVQLEDSKNLTVQPSSTPSGTKGVFRPHSVRTDIYPREGRVVFSNGSPNPIRIEDVLVRPQGTLRSKRSYVNILLQPGQSLRVDLKFHLHAGDTISIVTDPVLPPGVLVPTFH